VTDLKPSFVQELRNPNPRVLGVQAAHLSAVSAHREQVVCRYVFPPFLRCQRRPYLTFLVEDQMIHDQYSVRLRSDGHTKQPDAFRAGAVVVKLIPRTVVFSEPVFMLVKSTKHLGSEIKNVLSEYLVARDPVAAVGCCKRIPRGTAVEESQVSIEQEHHVVLRFQ